MSNQKDNWLHKHFMVERDFEAEHAVHQTYHEISPHYHEFYELYFFISGNADYVVGNARYLLEPGDMIFVPPDLIHSPVFRDFESQYERCVVWVTNGLMNYLFRMDADLTLFSLKNKENIYLYRSGEDGIRRYQPLFDTICHAYDGRRMCHRSEGTAALLTLLTEYNRALDGQNECLHPASRDSMLTDLLRYISDNLANDLSLDTVAKVFFTNKYHLSHLFKQNMHISYYQYVIQMRLLLGKNRILAGEPVAQVWEQCGFSDHAGFYRAFRKAYGVSPSKYAEVHAAMQTDTLPPDGEKN